VTPRQIAEGLSEAQRKAIPLFTIGSWYAGADLGIRNGSVLGRLADKGILNRRADQRADRSQYTLSALGLLVRAELEAMK
jgi:hypothetical protein